MCNNSWNNSWHPCHPHWDNSCSCDNDTNRPATLTGQVLDTRCGALLVCDCETSQKVQVNTDDACSYDVGDRLCIHYDGSMTRSIPPQINATCIHKVSSPSNGCSCYNSCPCSNSCYC